jgi:hypothetical protein
MKTNIRIATIQDIEQIVPLLISLDDHHVNMYPSVFDVTKITVEKRTAFLSNNINEPNNLFFNSRNQYYHSWSGSLLYTGNKKIIQLKKIKM